MTSQAKNILYALALAVLVWGVWLYRGRSVSAPLRIQGNTMGTTYHITYFDAQQRDLKLVVDSLLDALNRSVSAYIPDAEISRYNGGSSLAYESAHLPFLLERSRRIVAISGGRFDPTVMPLVNAWGFGPGEPSHPDSTKIDSIRTFVGFDKILFNADSVWKQDARVQLDFSAIAKGYGVDLVAALLQGKGIKDFFVEIGGETLARGKNAQASRLWEVGILNPAWEADSAQRYIAYVALDDRALATSGNYFNRYEEDGRSYTHIVDPRSGYSAQSNMLSASVFAKSCADADAWATALMVAGYPQALELIGGQPEIDALLIYQADGGMAMQSTPGIAPFIEASIKEKKSTTR